MLIASNIAPSIKIFLVVFSTSVFTPPITPAIHTGFTPSVITISFWVRILFLPSNVVISSFSLASLTTILLPKLS